MRNRTVRSILISLLSSQAKLEAEQTHLSTSDTGAQAVLRDGDLLVNDAISEAILAVRHGAHEDGDGVIRRDRRG